MTKTALVISCLIGTLSPLQAQGAPTDPWAPVRFLVGEWRGALSGDHGQGTVSRRYRYNLSGQFLQERNMASFPPQPLHPDGTVATHASFLGQDHARKTLVFRLFREDRFNGAYAYSAAQSTPTRLVFESVQLDSATATTRAREILEVVSPDEHVETLEVAEGGKPFAVHSRIRFKRP